MKPTIGPVSSGEMWILEVVVLSFYDVMCTCMCASARSLALGAG